MRQSLPLPVEILGIIFYLATAGCRIQDLTTLMLVCTDFQDIMFSAPHLWADLLVEFNHNADLSKLVTQLDTLFKRARNQRISLSLHYDSEVPHLAINSLKDFLLDTAFSFRIQSLSIRLSESIDFGSLYMRDREDAHRALNDWQFLQHFLEIAEEKDTKPFQHLEYLSLTILDMPLHFQPQTFREGFPNLKVLTLNGSPRYYDADDDWILETVDWTGIDFGGLKSLTVEPFLETDGADPAAYPCHIILSGAPDLEFLSLSIPPLKSFGREFAIRESPFFGTVLVHETLTKLVLRGSMSNIEYLWPALVLPRLRSLRLEGEKCAQYPEHRRCDCRDLATDIASKIEKLVRDSGCELEELVINFHIPWADEQLAGLRSLLPATARLTAT